MNMIKAHLKKLKITAAFLIGIIIVSFIISFALIASNNKKAVYFGTVIAISSFVLVMFILGLIQFIPSIYKGRSRTKLIVMWIFGICWILASISLIIGDLPNYYKDIPKVINSDYSSYEGKLTSYHISHGRTTTTSFTIEGRQFHVKGEYDAGVLIEGRKYRVEYLPNTQYVMNLYSY